LRWTSAQKPIGIGGITVSPGEVIHANAEGVIKLPAAALEKLPERAAAMRAFESRTHALWRQPGVSIEEKKKGVMEYLVEFGFDKP
jgi:regulator of RNase E activity RraA